MTRRVKSGTDSNTRQLPLFVFIVMTISDMVAQVATSDGPAPIESGDPRATDIDARADPDDLAIDVDFEREMRHLEECPFCSEKAVEIDGDPVQGRIVHRCTASRCDEDVLPLYLTD